ncbi:MAG: tRNA-dihydrouridine synthase [Treponema sp.]|jgi:nifR3 family TIM-barrel protein|nr:tRNA-dihydrouridine synthase [Treponema sp.]
MTEKKFTGPHKTESPAAEDAHRPFYHSMTIGSLNLPGNLLLAPVAGYTGRAFRSLCAEAGANLGFTELVSAESLIRKPPERMEDPHNPVAVLLRRGGGERFYGVQLFGAVPERIYQAAALLAPWKPDALDINGGCPVPKVTKTGAGSALMRDPANLGRVVEAAVRASREHLGDIPVTIKIRSGWDNSSINYAECARIAVEAGAAMISLHPRTKTQGYGGRSDWACIADLVSLLPVPVTGSGDLSGPEDAERMFRETGCVAVMFARGAMGNPFIFTETRSLLETGVWKAATPAARIAAAFRQLELMAADMGERRACLEMRKQFCAAVSGGPDRPGIPGGAALRGSLSRIETIDNCRRILAEAGLLP